MTTLAQWAKLESDKVLAGSFENIITASELMPWIDFVSHAGNAKVYNREDALPTATMNQVGGTWTDQEPTFTKKTAELKIVGVQSPLDLYVKATRGTEQDPKAVLIASMAKSLGRKIEGQVIVGNPGAASTDMEGMTSLLISDTRLMMMDDASQPGTITGNETELTLDRLDQMIDLIENGLPTVLIMNKTMRRKLTSLSRAAGSGVLMTSTNEDFGIANFGRQVFRYNTIPIVISDYITNAETYENSGGWPSSTATTIFAFKFGEENQGHSVMHNGPVMTPQLQELGIKFNKNEEVFRMVVYLEAMLFSAKMGAGLAGIDANA